MIGMILRCWNRFSLWCISLSTNVDVWEVLRRGSRMTFVNIYVDHYHFSVFTSDACGRYSVLVENHLFMLIFIRLRHIGFTLWHVNFHICWYVLVSLWWNPFQLASGVWILMTPHTCSSIAKWFYAFLLP